MIACTPDRTGRLNGILVNIDIKGGAKAKWHPFQTAFQNICLTSQQSGYSWCDEDSIVRYALYLRDNGRYKLESHEDPKDFEVAKAAATIHHTKRGM